MRRFLPLLSLAMLSLLSGCGSVRLASPETSREKLAYAVAGNAAIRLKADGSLRAKTISPATGAMVLSVTDASRRLLNVAGSELGVPITDAKADAVAPTPDLDGKKADTIDQLVAEAVSARSAAQPIRAVSTMIDAAHAAGGDLTDETMLAIYGMDDEARDALVKTLEGR